MFSWLDVLRVFHPYLVQCCTGFASSESQSKLRWVLSDLSSPVLTRKVRGSKEWNGNWIFSPVVNCLLKVIWMNFSIQFMLCLWYWLINWEEKVWLKMHGHLENIAELGPQILEDSYLFLEMTSLVTESQGTSPGPISSWKGLGMGHWELSKVLNISSEGDCCFFRQPFPLFQCSLSLSSAAIAVLYTVLHKVLLFPSKGFCSQLILAVPHPWAAESHLLALVPCFWVVSLAYQDLLPLEWAQLPSGEGWGPPASCTGTCCLCHLAAGNRAFPGTSAQQALGKLISSILVCILFHLCASLYNMRILQCWCVSCFNRSRVLINGVVFDILFVSNQKLWRAFENKSSELISSVCLRGKHFLMLLNVSFILSSTVIILKFGVCCQHGWDWSGYSK